MRRVASGRASGIKTAPNLHAEQKKDPLWRPLTGEAERRKKKKKKKTRGRVKHQVKERYDLSKGNYSKMREMIKDHNWTTLSEMEMEEAWGHMKTVIQNAMLNCIPKVRKCNKKRFHTCMDEQESS